MLRVHRLHRRRPPQPVPTSSYGQGTYRRRSFPRQLQRVGGSWLVVGLAEQLGDGVFVHAEGSPGRTPANPGTSSRLSIVGRTYRRKRLPHQSLTESCGYGQRGERRKGIAFQGEDFTDDKWGQR